MNWERIKWPYNDAKPYCDWECWTATANGCRIILYPGMWPKEGWSFVVKSCYSGFLKGFVSLESAKWEIELRAKRNKI